MINYLQIYMDLLATAHLALCTIGKIQKQCCVSRHWSRLLTYGVSALCDITKGHFFKLWPQVFLGRKFLLSTGFSKRRPLWGPSGWGPATTQVSWCVCWRRFQWPAGLCSDFTFQLDWCGEVFFLFSFFFNERNADIPQLWGTFLRMFGKR